MQQLTPKGRPKDFGETVGIDTHGKLVFVAIVNAFSAPRFNDRDASAGMSSMQCFAPETPLLAWRGHVTGSHPAGRRSTLQRSRLKPSTKNHKEKKSTVSCNKTFRKPNLRCRYHRILLSHRSGLTLRAAQLLSRNSFLGLRQYSKRSWPPRNWTTYDYWWYHP